MSNVIPIREDEWLAEWERIEEEKFAGEGASVMELKKLWDVSELTARKRVRTLLDAGKLRVSEKRAMRIDGRTAIVPSYVLVRP